MKTAEVKLLFEEVMETLPKPYTNNVIDEVFFAIEKNPSWLSKYDFLCSNLSRDVVNNWGGYWIASKIGKNGKQQVPSKKSTLIGSYSILDTDNFVKNPNKDEALQLMAAYYKAHKNELPSSIRDHREIIIELIMLGRTAEDAFTEALKS